MEGTLSFNKPQRWFALGIIDSAKSSFLEHIAEGYLGNNHTVLDLFGSRDGEGLAWLRSPWVKDKKVLLLHGENSDVKSSFDTKAVGKLQLRDLDDYDLLISATPLYSSPNQEFREVNRVLDLLYQRQSWKRLVCAIVREASNIFYSRLRVSGDQLQAKAEAVYLTRESRHMGISLLMDSLRFYSIDIDMRNLVDYQVIKALGLFGLPRDLEWLYHMVNPTWIRNMPKGAFVMLSRTGSIGIGSFPKIPWHKQEGENILRAIDLKVEYGEEPQVGKDRNTFKTIGDEEHAEIMSQYLDEKKGMCRIAELRKRSSATISEQIRHHDEAIERSGFCPKCKRINGSHLTENAKKEVVAA